MRSQTVAQLLATLGITKSHSRPHVSDDNPFSESQFKTLKYRPEFPDRFASIEHGLDFCGKFFHWQNHEHHHWGLGLLTPATVHHGQADAVLAARQAVLTAAYAAHPERFVRQPPRPLALPSEVWINKPKAALAELNRNSEPEVVTNFAPRAPQSPAADSTHTAVSPARRSSAIPHRSAVNSTSRPSRRSTRRIYTKLGAQPLIRPSNVRGRPARAASWVSKSVTAAASFSEMAKSLTAPSAGRSTSRLQWA